MNAPRLPIIVNNPEGVNPLILFAVSMGLTPNLVAGYSLTLCMTPNHVMRSEILMSISLIQTKP